MFEARLTYGTLNGLICGCWIFVKGLKADWGTVGSGYVVCGFSWSTVSSFKIGLYFFLDFLEVDDEDEEASDSVSDFLALLPSYCDLINFGLSESFWAF